MNQMLFVGMGPYFTYKAYKPAEPPRDIFGSPPVGVRRPFHVIVDYPPSRRGLPRWGLIGEPGNMKVCKQRLEQEQNRARLEGISRTYRIVPCTWWRMIFHTPPNRS